MVAFVATRSLDAREKLYLSVLDKFFLGAAAAGVGYWLQQRLEIFKRNQAFASELAKARIAAYTRAFAAVSSYDFAGFRVIDAAEQFARASSRKEKGDAAAELTEQEAEWRKEEKSLTDLLNADRYLLGDPFVKAANLLMQQTGFDIERAKSETSPNRDESMRRRGTRTKLRESIALYLPRFARIPDDDLHFAVPDPGPAIAELSEEMRQIQEKKTPKVEAP